MSTFKQVVSDKKSNLANAVQQQLADIAAQVAEVWPDADRIDKILIAARETLPYFNLLYVLKADGTQLSSSVEPHNISPDWRGRDQSGRPYLNHNLPYKGIMLSSLYVSIFTHKQCITALHAINKDDEMLGFVAMDVSINDIPDTSQVQAQDAVWHQFRGDPAVRGTVFMQQRVPSLMDAHIDEVTDLMVLLICEHGVFHSKVHFSSGRCSIWLLDDPYSYRIHHVEEIIDPDICLAYPLHDYPERAIVTPDEVREVFEQFKSLRFIDETIYLRSSSLNIINGMVGLTFSCDGSHYMPVKEFLERDMAFWLGNASNQT